MAFINTTLWGIPTRIIFKLPIPKSVWQISKEFQNAAFVKFMDGIVG